MRSIDQQMAIMNDLDRVANLNAHDDEGLGWSTLADAAAPELLIERGSR